MFCYSGFSYGTFICLFFRKFYAELSDLCTATSIVLFVFCQTALFRIAPILTLIFVVITLHQCFSSWMGVQDVNDSPTNVVNDKTTGFNHNTSNDDDM